MTVSRSIEVARNRTVNTTSKAIERCNRAIAQASPGDTTFRQICVLRDYLRYALKRRTHVPLRQLM